MQFDLNLVRMSILVWREFNLTWRCPIWGENDISFFWFLRFCFLFLFLPTILRTRAYQLLISLFTYPTNYRKYVGLVRRLSIFPSQLLFVIVWAPCLHDLLKAAILVTSVFSENTAPELAISRLSPGGQTAPAPSRSTPPNRQRINRLVAHDWSSFAVCANTAAHATRHYHHLYNERRMRERRRCFALFWRDFRENEVRIGT